MYGALSILGHFQLGANQTQTAGTVITQAIPPMRGAITNLTQLVVSQGGTAHDVYVLRPLNYTTLSADAAASQAVVNLTADPGLYATKYQYPLLNAGPSGTVPPTLPTFQTADNGIAANDFCFIETPDGAGWLAKVSSVATLAVTMTANVPTGGVKAGARVWFFGIISDTDPATALTQFRYTMTASAVNTLAGLSVGGASLISGLHAGDPLLVYDANATAADTLIRVEGYYSKF